MKHHNNNDKTHTNAPRPVTVYFEFTNPAAHSVSVAGSFNDWDPTTQAMQPTGKGYWLRQTRLLPGSYEYCLVVDGQWMPDPLAKECVPNPFGGQNSVLNVGASTEAGHRSDASRLPLKNANQ